MHWTGRWTREGDPQSGAQDQTWRLGSHQQGEAAATVAWRSGSHLSSEKTAAPAQSRGKRPPLRASSGQGPSKGTEEKRKRKARAESDPSHQGRSFRKDWWSVGSISVQVRERLKVSIGFGNMKVTGDLCQSSFRGVGAGGVCSGLRDESRIESTGHQIS